MSDENNYFLQDRNAQLRGYITMEMMRGAGYAAAGFVAILLFIWVLTIIGSFLPEESRQTPDPMPRSSIDMPFDPDRALI